MTSALHPEFPVVSGRYQLTGEWSALLPEEFNRRTEDGSLVIWRPALTFWINVWGPKANASLEERMQAVLSRANPKRTAERVERTAELILLTYEVPQHDPERPKPNYTSISGYIFGTQGHVQISAYFDTPSARATAYQVIHSVRSAA